MKTGRVGKNSIVVRIILLLMLVIFLQSVFSLSTIIGTDITTKIESFSYSTFTKTVQNRKGNIENFMTSTWSNIANVNESISKKYIDMLGDRDELTEDEKTVFLEECATVIMEMIDNTGTTGGFIVLDDGEDMKYSYSSLYLKNENYSKQTMNEDNFMLARGPSEISKKYNFPLVTNWSYAWELNENNIEILRKPIMESENIKSVDYLGYWDIISDITNDKTQVLTYSMPIFDSNQNAIGVMGVEIAQEYLYKFLPDDEFGESGSYGYVFANVDNENGTIVPITSNGVWQNENVYLDDTIYTASLDFERHNLEYLPRIFNTDSNADICVYYEKLDVYVNNTPFLDNNIWIVGMVELDTMTSFTDDFWKSMAFMVISFMIGGIIIAYFMGKKIALPITNLSEAVSTIDVSNEIRFKRTNITEIDELAKVIKQLQQENIIRTATKTDRILELLNMAVGSFEYIKSTDYVTVSRSIYKMFGIDVDEEKHGQIINEKVFFERLNSLKENPIEEMENAYAVGVNNIKYYKVVEYEQKDAILGVIEDVTKEVEDLIIMNYDRNYDMLTGIFNRRAFYKKVEEVFKADNMRIAGFVMFDLDNLKYVNDTFGHDSGDVYIKTAANIIYTSLQQYGVVGRMSGDEFYAYLYGFNDKEKLLKSLRDLYKRLEVEPIEMPNSKMFQIRMSGGIAWYNDDSNKLEELVKFADFAMYKGKKSLKGQLREFDKEAYLNESFMLSGKEELNRILDEELFDFVFQPIVNVKTGKIHAYEALMRPMSEILASPDKFLQIASLEGKLWKVERITFFKTLALYEKYEKMFNGAKMFINSIPSENLKDSEYIELKAKYGKYLSNLVVEITEQEQQTEAIITAKLSKLRGLQLEIALDDYGSGYANDVSLLNIKPNIVKIDRSLISNVHVDPSRQTIVNKIIVFCKENNISVLGEGIETEQELEYLIGAGIDLAQGYYISRPLEFPEFDTSYFEKTIQIIKKQ